MSKFKRDHSQWLQNEMIAVNKSIGPKPKPFLESGPTA